MNKQTGFTPLIGAVAVIAVALITALFCRGMMHTGKFSDYEDDDTSRTASIAADISLPDTKKENDDPYENDGPYKYYVSTLNTEQQEAYYAILDEIEAMPKRIRIPKLSSDELLEVFTAVDYDNPRLFFIGTDCYSVSVGGISYITIDYTLSYDEYREQLAAADAAADRIITSLSLPGNPWQSEREIHDAIVNGTSYNADKENPAYCSPYGTLVNREACCEGYARAAKFIFDKIGIESVLLSGQATNSSGQSDAHMWNAVRINGTWCHLDITWDDPVGAAFTDYSYFNISDKEIGIDHSDWHFSEKCISDSLSYYYMKGLYCTSWNSTSATALATPVAKEINAGCRAITVKFADEATYQAAVSSLFDGQEVYKLLKKAAAEATAAFSTSSLQYTKNNDKFTITLVIE